MFQLTITLKVSSTWNVRWKMVLPLRDDRAVDIRTLADKF